MHPKKSGSAPTAYEAFTDFGDKTADLAIYYNIAVANLNEIRKAINASTANPDTQLARLAEYLWSAHKDAKNSRGYELTPDDKVIINELCKKVEDIRNFYSHQWHDPCVLECSGQLVSFINDRYKLAAAMVAKDDPAAVADYEALLGKREYKPYKLFNGSVLTVEGRIFFLSFFLSSGQLSQLMQQRRGFKRTDMPLFRAKRKIYLYYTLRDGATMAHFHQEQSVLSTLSAEDQKQVLKARTAYKLISYLNDYPDFWGNTEKMPLYLSKGKKIENIDNLYEYLQQHPELLPDFEFAPPDEEETGIRKHILFTHEGLPGYEFKMDFPMLYRLVVLMQLFNATVLQESPVDTLLQNLRTVIEGRQKLFDILNTRLKDRTAEDLAFLLDRKNQHLRGSRLLTETSITFFEQLEKGYQEDNAQRKMIIAAIRSFQTYQEDEPLPEPIQVYQQDLVSTTDRKFRPGNRFMHYAATYLMDFAGDDWYWGVENFEMDQLNGNEHETLVKRKRYFKASEIPDQYRLTLEDDHVYIAIRRDTSGDKNFEQFIQFSIGRQAMKYLMAFVLSKNGKAYQQVIRKFFDKLKADIIRLKEDGGFKADHTYHLLEEAFVSPYLKPAPDSDWKTVEEAVNRRITQLKEKWQNILQNLDYMRRAEKNRAIMEAYKLFDWPRDAKTKAPKFFRKHEYNYMSICHYEIASPKKGKRRNNLEQLYNWQFKLAGRKPKIPKKIEDLLFRAKSLDDLLINVLKDRRNDLNKRKAALHKSTGAARISMLADLCRYLRLSVPAGLQQEAGQQALHKQRMETLDVLPFPIHPMLVMKAFFSKQYGKGKTEFKILEKDNLQQKVHPAHNIFANVRKNYALLKGLYASHYQASVAEVLYPGEISAGSRKKLTGLINDTLTEDVLLWWMAQQYLQNNGYTGNMAAQLLHPTKKEYHVGNLHRVAITFPLRGQPFIYTTVLLHQLDDMMFRTLEDYLYRAAVHYVNRHTNERAIWEDNELSIDKINPGAPFPDGSLQHPVSFDILRDEISLVRRTGKKFAAAILNFERKVLSTAADSLFGGDLNQLHQYLLGTCQTPGSACHHYNFAKLLELAQTLGWKDLDIIRDELNGDPSNRNIALHNDIPQAGSFSWMTRPGTKLREVLGIEEDLHAKKDHSRYVGLGNG